mgnify:CR=1 FL=1
MNDARVRRSIAVIRASQGLDPRAPGQRKPRCRHRSHGQQMRTSLERARERSSISACTRQLDSYARGCCLLARYMQDLEEQRKVPTQTAKTYAERNGLIFMECSAKTSTNIVELFSTIGTLTVTVTVVARALWMSRWLEH